MKYPKNIEDYFQTGQNEEFNKWAFGCLQPGSNKKMIELWNNLHLEYPMEENELLYFCICKMGYLYYLSMKE
jgi:hypothetical protein